MRAILAFLFTMGLLAACGSDTGTTGDAGTDAKKAYDAGPDTQLDDADYPDTADSAYVPMTCDPNSDAGDTCGIARACCPVGNSGPDGGPVYQCVFLKAGNTSCPPAGG